MTPFASDCRPAVCTQDLHDAALYAWRASTRRECTLVHLDAHLDCEPLAGCDVHIGNFIRAAIGERLVARVFWVVPDPIWASRSSRTVLTRELRLAADRRPSGWTAEIAGATVSVCALADLPRLSDPVHLDIDLDYLFYSARRRHDDRPSVVPWIWPRDLAPALLALDLHVDSITIASSISGGFAPLKWKHLAEELALRLSGEADGSGAVIEAYESIAAAAILPSQAQVTALQQLEARCPETAAVSFHLAEALQSVGEIEQARRMFGASVAIDPEYRHLYRSEGAIEQGVGRRAAAHAEYERALHLDPLDPFSRIGLAQLAEDAGRTDEARALFEAALSQSGGELIDAYRGLARTLERSDPERAITAYEASLKLAVAGQVPLSAPPCANRERRLVDPAHFSVYGRIGCLHERLGRRGPARVNYVLAATREPYYRLCLGRLRLRDLDARGALDLAHAVVGLLARAARRAFGAPERAWYNLGLP